MSFNIKKDRKKKIARGNKSIEQLHDEKLKYFNDLNNSLPKKKKELASLVKKDPRSRNIPELEENIKNIEGQIEENDYHLSVNKILMNFCLINDDTDISVIDIENMIHDKNNSKIELTKEYYHICGLNYIEDDSFTNEQYHCLMYCDICDKELLLTNEKIYTCISCGKMFDKVFDGVSYNDMETSNIIFPFVYKRINYFTEWLMQIQASENVEIEESLLDSIKIELYKRNINDSSKLNHSKLKTILKELDMPRYYEHIPLLISKICGTKPLSIPQDISDKLKEMFMTIQEPYEELKGDRKNFFSYPYILYKFCEILGLHGYLHHFQLLKNREKLRNQDRLWEKIIDRLRTRDPILWVYIPTC